MSSPTILVSDHSAPLAEYVKTILESEGYAVRVSNSSTEALSEGTRYKPGLLIIDPVMPGLSGVEVALRICRQGSCKVLFLSALADDSDFKDVVKGVRQQGCDVRALPKPFEINDLLDCVRRAVGAPPDREDVSDRSLVLEESNEQQSAGSPAADFAAGVGSNGEYAALLKMAGLNLYRSNAFRITGLGISSSLREVSRKAEKLEMMIKLGSIQPAGGLFPLKDPPPPSEIRAAVQALKDPEQRLIHEFFWFWPSTEIETDDPALQALQAGKHFQAIEIWTQAKGKATEIGVHNLAVLYHLEALGTYLRRSAVKAVTKSEDIYLWKSAFRYWNALIDRSEFWSALTDRIRATNDPRLRIEVAQQIWKTLPTAIVRINAEVATAAAEKGEFEEASTHRKLMFTSAFGESVARNELLRALAPIREQLNHLCNSAERETRTNLRSANKIVRKLLDDKSRLLQPLNYLLGVGDEVCANAHDVVALTARSCVVDYINETTD